jgi:hypothetical protein
MLDELLKEITELKEYKHKYECSYQNNQTMSDLLYEFMMEKYNNTSLEERILNYKNKTCNMCRYWDDCGLNLPENIGEPIKSDKAWIPAIKGCGKFQWR